MVDDFENYADLNGGATATTIREAADSPGTHAATLQVLVDDLADDSAQIRSTIEGDFQDATTMNLQPASDAARRLTQSGLYAVGLLNSLADTVETFDTTVETLNTELHDNTYARWQAQNTTTNDNSEAGSGGESEDGPPELSYADIMAEEKAKLQPRYNTAHNTLENEADRVAGLFEGSPDLADVKQLVLAGYIPLSMAGVWPNLNLTADETKQAQLNTVKNMTPAEQVEYVKNTKDIDPAIAAVITPEAQRTLANDVAKDIKDTDVDEQTVRIMSLLKDQQPFAHALYSNVEPNDVSNAIRDMSSDTFPPGSNPPYDQADRAELYKNFLDAAGSTLATYTKGTGEYAPPSGLAQTWYDSIVDKNHPENAAALTLLIKHGGQQSSFDPDFLSEVTDKVYDWERSHDGDPVWGPRNEEMGDYGIKDPTVDRGDPDDPYDDVASYKGAYDGLANLLGGMEKTPEAAHQFFNDGETTDYHDQPINEKLKYLLADRRWPTDEGDGAGIALEGATLFDRTDSPAGKESAELASQMVRVIAGESDRSNGFPNVMNNWHLPEGMTDNVGNITASYIGDLMDAATSEGDSNDTSGGDWTNGGDGGPYGIRADKDTWGKLLFELGQNDDKTGLQTVVTSAVVHTNDETSRILHDYSDPNDLTVAALDRTNGDDPSILQRLSDHATTSGSGLNFIYENGMEGGHSAEEADATRREIFSKAFGVATDFVPTPAGKVAGVITSTGLSELNDAIGNAPDSASDGWKPGSTEGMKRELQFGTYNALLQNGYLDPQKDPNYGLDPNFTVTTDGNTTIDPNLHNSEHGDATARPGDTRTPSQLEDDFAEWLAGSDEKDKPGAPSSLFGQFLESYAGAAIK